MYALRRSCCRNQSTARMRPSAKTSGTTRASRCVATQPGSPSSNLMRRRGYVAASCASENARGSSVRADSSATQSPTAGASISSRGRARDLAEDLVEIERRGDEARQPGDLLEAGEPPVGGRPLAVAAGRSRPPASSRSRRGPVRRLRRPAPCIRSAGSGMRRRRRPRARRPGSSRRARRPRGSCTPGSRSRPPSPPAPRPCPPGNFGTGGARRGHERPPASRVPRDGRAVTRTASPADGPARSRARRRGSRRHAERSDHK